MTELQTWANKKVQAYEADLIRDYTKSEVVSRPVSKSDPSVQYMVLRHHNGTLTCNCPGYLYRRSCRHTWGGQYTK